MIRVWTRTGDADLSKVGQIAEEIRNLHELRLELIREKLNAT